MYGLDNYLLSPPFSVFVSIILIFSLDAIGLLFIKTLSFADPMVKWVRWQAPIIGATTLAIIFYPLALIGFANLSVLRIVVLGLMAISFIHLFLILKNYRHYFHHFLEWFESNLHLKLLLFLMMLGYALLSLSPITNADSLDYHIGVALHILNTGNMPATPEWFHSRVSGNGEVLNAIGFAAGAEQFGSLLQFVSLVSILGLIYHAGSNPSERANRIKEFDDRWRLLLTIAAASPPVLVALIGSVKPQLLPAAMTSLALALCLFPSRRELDKSRSLKGFGLVCLLVMTASQAKFSFLLGGGVVGLIAFFLMVKRQLLLLAVVVSTVSFLLIMMPPAIWKSVNFNSGLLESLLTPFPGNWAGTDRFESFLRSYRDTDLLFPFSLIIPSSLGLLSTVLGIGIGYFVFLKPQHSYPLTVMTTAAFFVFFIALIVGPFTSRSYIEPYYWLLMVLVLQPTPVFFSRNYKWIKILTLLQACLLLCICWYGIITSLQGAFSLSARNLIMNRLANGYSIVEWAEKTLPVDAVVLTQHRSMMGLLPRRAISLDWIGYVNIDSEESAQYLDRIKKSNVTHLLILRDDYKNSKPYILFEGCLSSQVITSPEYLVATRNPFNSTSAHKYSVLIIDFNSQELPECAQNK